jgi:hypothetical protein
VALTPLIPHKKLYHVSWFFFFLKKLNFEKKNKRKEDGRGCPPLQGGQPPSAWATPLFGVAVWAIPFAGGGSSAGGDRPLVRRDGPIWVFLFFIFFKKNYLTHAVLDGFGRSKAKNVEKIKELKVGFRKRE